MNPAVPAAVSGQVCPVCGAMADSLALTCASCGAFVRDRVATLNFFETIFSMVEQPRQTFLRIARSEQKNYVLMLFGFSGIAITTIVLFLARISDLQWHFASILAGTFIGGPVFGIVAWTLLAWLASMLTNRLWKPGLPYRLTSSFVAYSLVPLLPVSLILAPIEMAVFGGNAFSVDPAPWVLKPTVFWTLATLNIVFYVGVLWLSSLGFQVLGLSRAKSLMITSIIHGTLAVMVAIAAWILSVVTS